MSIIGPIPLPTYFLWVNLCNHWVKSCCRLTSQQQGGGASLKQEVLSPTILMAKLQAKAVRTAVAAAHVTRGHFQSTPAVPPPPEVPSMKQFFGFVFVLKQKVPAAFWRGRKADSGYRPYTSLGNTAGIRIKRFFKPPPPKQWGKELECWQLTAFPPWVRADWKSPLLTTQSQKGCPWVTSPGRGLPPLPPSLWPLFGSRTARLPGKQGRPWKHCTSSSKVGNCHGNIAILITMF